MNLAERSVEVILAGQAPSGAYVASPSFAQYRYSWWRDGAFIADAMSRVGERESTERFFDFCAARVRERPHGPWPTRYRLDGSADDVAEWPAQQWDGLGLWLWAVANHCHRHGVASRWFDETARVEEWLREHWREPCHDWWEEREGVHAATLASIWAGIGTAEVRDAVDVGAERLDGSHAFVVALGIADWDHLDRIEQQLGYHRHADDEYYGGGEWLILAAFVGWARVVSGDDATPHLEWIESRANADGTFPEQVPPLLRPERYEPWVEKWGPPPSPLLWSHAMYITLRDVIGA